ncbi:cold-shock protein [Lentibacillus salicampi]|uniref:Cold-shock protein n=1 Tax=Lentibacillus salicampi TaxID=175306 RepID=A0A4Y9AGU2_9BACI|nr:cold-shock protein [Lentibacillus salicampi]TFJ94307.1 cold-shock protein [Lentibacillus salicampi]
MSFSRGPKQPVPEVETNVWSCTNEDCAGWMRESFSFNEEPECPLCHASMEKEVRVLPELEH